MASYPYSLLMPVSKVGSGLTITLNQKRITEQLVCDFLMFASSEILRYSV